jgi:hypothetical protein
MTEKSEKPAAAVAAAAKPAAPKKAKQILVAVHNINGTIEPGTPFTGSAKDLKEMLDLGAAREPEGEAELALFEKIADTIVDLSGGDDLAAALN